MYRLAGPGTALARCTAFRREGSSVYRRTPSGGVVRVPAAVRSRVSGRSQGAHRASVRCAHGALKGLRTARELAGAASFICLESEASLTYDIRIKISKRAIMVELKCVA